MNSSSNFNFQLTKTRRKKRLSEVMPVGEDLVYFILLSDAYLTDGKNERHIHSLEDIKDVFEGDEGLRLLQAARAKGQLTEQCSELKLASSVSC